MGNEIEAMGQLDTALGELDAEERARVLTWAVAKFGEGVVVNSRTATTGAGAGGGDDRGANDGDTGGGGSGDAPVYARISDLMDAASPSNGLNYVLVASYWFQEIEGKESFTGHQVNSALRDLGHSAANITSAYDSLKARKPPLARQIQKSGTTKQARKQYRLTTEGVRAVERLINGKDKDEA